MLQTDGSGDGPSGKARKVGFGSSLESDELVVAVIFSPWTCASCGGP